MNPTVPATDLIGYAREVEAMLKAQRRYFDCKGGPDKPRLLSEARNWEQRVWTRTQDVLDRIAQPGLFDQDGA